MGSSESISREYTQEMIDERNRLLNTQINQICLFMQPSNKFIFGYEFAVAGISALLPAEITCAQRNHMGIFVYGENDSEDGVFIEFGPYDYKNEKKIDRIVHYHQGEDGLRFFSANCNDIEGFRVDCEVEYKMTVRTLLNGLAHHGWTKADYEEVEYNPILKIYDHKDSKDFARKVIKTIGAKRIKKSTRIRTLSKICIPASIIDALESNENCINFEERIPIIGLFVGIVKLITTKDDE